jgi:hypothetical protein
MTKFSTKKLHNAQKAQLFKQLTFSANFEIPAIGVIQTLCVTIKKRTDQQQFGRKRKDRPHADTFCSTINFALTHP